MNIEASNSYLKDLVEIAVNIINKKATIISQLDLNQLYFEFEELPGNIEGTFTNELNDNNEYIITISNTLNERSIIDTLIHELIHYYTYIWFNISEDDSPIFIGILLYINPNEDNAYKCFAEFKEGVLYKHIRQAKNFKAVLNILKHI